MLYDLLGRNLSKFNIRQVPQTSALDEQVMRSLETDELWWADQFGRVCSNAEWQFQVRSSLQASFKEALGRNDHGKSSATRLGMFWKTVLPMGWPKKVSYPCRSTSPRCPPVPTAARRRAGTGPDVLPGLPVRLIEAGRRDDAPLAPRPWRLVAGLGGQLLTASVGRSASKFWQTTGSGPIGRPPAQDRRQRRGRHG